uniref:Uncharacterized protein n=1 Tax=Arundo donax TaxID=35708 RepID=A0A0A9BCI3_ARUDO
MLCVLSFIPTSSTYDLYVQIMSLTLSSTYID